MQSPHLAGIDVIVSYVKESNTYLPGFWEGNVYYPGARDLLCSLAQREALVTIHVITTWQLGVPQFENALKDLAAHGSVVLKGLDPQKSSTKATGWLPHHSEVYGVNVFKCAKPSNPRRTISNRSTDFDFVTQRGRSVDGDEVTTIFTERFEECWRCPTQMHEGNVESIRYRFWERSDRLNRLMLKFGNKDALIQLKNYIPPLEKQMIVLKRKIRYGDQKRELDTQRHPEQYREDWDTMKCPFGAPQSNMDYVQAHAMYEGTVHQAGEPQLGLPVPTVLDRVQDDTTPDMFEPLTLADLNKIADLTIQLFKCLATQTTPGRRATC